MEIALSLECPGEKESGTDPNPQALNHTPCMRTQAFSALGLNPGHRTPQDTMEIALALECPGGKEGDAWD